MRSRTGKSVDTKSGSRVPGLEDEGRGMTTNGYRVSFWADESVLVSQPGEYVKNH